MTVRTITQLPEVLAFNSAISSSYMEMSVPLNMNNDRFSSKKVQYGNIVNDIKTQTITKIVTDYNLSGINGKVNINALRNDVDTISVEDSIFYGQKQFNKWPYISADFPKAEDITQVSNIAYGSNYENIIPNMKIVRQLVDDNVVFMSTTSSLVAEGNPLPLHGNSATNAGVVESLEYASTIGRGLFYYWHIDAQQCDSSQSIHDANSGSTDGYEEIRDTGNLVVWGWLAENRLSPPEPEQCWVAMFAKMKCEGYNDTEVDVPICVKPWIRGKNSSTIQYVGFNIPVRKGIRIKIKTGFPVNNENGGLQNPGSLTFLDGNIPNAFFGYVIK